MSEYTISQVYPTDKTVLAQIDTLLGQEGIRRDGNLDYICAMFDEEYNVIGTGSCFGNTLRCFAVSSAHQGEGLLNQIITHLIEVQCARGNMHLFLYTKVKSSKFSATSASTRSPGWRIPLSSWKTAATASGLICAIWKRLGPRAKVRPSS